MSSDTQRHQSKPSEPVRDKSAEIGAKPIEHDVDHGVETPQPQPNPDSKPDEPGNVAKMTADGALSGF